VRSRSQRRKGAFFMPAGSAEIPGRLRDLARRVDRLKPLNHDPVRYFENRDEIRRDLELLAEELTAPHGVARANPRAAFEARDVHARGRVVKVSRRVCRG